MTPSTHEFVIDTPVERARKEFIGNAACHGRMAAVFAQLIVDGEPHGVHALAVPLRDDQGNLVPGVEIEDCGEKLGLNGVDNGMIWFRKVRVPREALLNRYGNVTADGAYESPIEDANKRFFTMLGTLVQGRVCISAGSLSAAKTALTIAIRYGLRRRQFGPAGKMEVPVLDYRTQQRRLMPRLAKTFALHFAQQELSAKFDKVFSDPSVSDRDRRQLESLAAGMKAVATWHSIDTIQQCRGVLWRRGLHGGQPVRRAEGRHRHLHDLRGRQHGADPARRAGSVDRLRQRLRRAWAPPRW